MPACCEEGCRVECQPDGKKKCPHGHFSILINLELFDRIKL